LERWDIANQTLLQTFTVCGSGGVCAVELNKDTIVSASGTIATAWRASTGEKLFSCCFEGEVEGLVKLTERHFATGSADKKIQLWDEHGHNYATYPRRQMRFT